MSGQAPGAGLHPYRGPLVQLFNIRRADMTTLDFYVKWGIRATYEMRDDLIAALDNQLPTTLPGETPSPEPGRSARPVPEAAA